MKKYVISVISGPNKKVDMQVEGRGGEPNSYYGSLLLNNKKVAEFVIDVRKLVSHGYKDPMEIKEKVELEEVLSRLNDESFRDFKNRLFKAPERVLTKIFDYLNLDKEDVNYLYGTFSRFRSLLNIYLESSVFNFAKIGDVVIVAKEKPRTFLCEVKYKDNLLLKIPKSSSYKMIYDIKYNNGWRVTKVRGANFYCTFALSPDNSVLKVMYHRYLRDFQIKVIDLATNENKVIFHSEKLRGEPLTNTIDDIAPILPYVEEFEIDGEKYLGICLTDILNDSTMSPDFGKNVKKTLGKYIKNILFKYMKFDHKEYCMFIPNEWTVREYNFAGAEVR